MAAVAHTASTRSAVRPLASWLDSPENSDPSPRLKEYWHGGAPGRSVGEYLLPPSLTGTTHVLSAFLGVASERPGWRCDRVYVASQYEVAAAFAAMFPNGGCLYRVLPEGELEADPDVTAPDQSLACERARVLSVVHLNPVMVVSILESMKGGAA